MTLNDFEDKIISTTERTITENNIQNTGTMGVTGDDVEALQNLKDIETAEGVCQIGRASCRERV